jgi:hypothetical protein
VIRARSSNGKGVDISSPEFHPRALDSIFVVILIGANYIGKSLSSFEMLGRKCSMAGDYEVVEHSKV